MRIAVAGGTGVVGRYVSEAAVSSGHEPVVLARSTGVDLVTGAGLSRSLEGIDVIIDAANISTTNATKATQFFTQATRNLHDVGASMGVTRLVTLSIVAIDRIPANGYYRAKLAQEAEATRGPLPATIVRATQFHEFAAQIMARTRRGPLAVMPVMRTQPIAARSAGQFLVEAAARSPHVELDSGPVEIAGPEPEDLVTMARRLARERRRHVVVIPIWMPGPAGKSMRDGSQLPEASARHLGPTYSAWLKTEDAKLPEI